jgi:hypothetical protein
LVHTFTCFRFLVYGDCFDRSVKYLEISETSMADSLKDFCQLVVSGIGEHYLNRTPSVEERNRILAFNKRRGFPGMLDNNKTNGTIDEYYTVENKKKTIIKQMEQLITTIKLKTQKMTTVRQMEQLTSTIKFETKDNDKTNKK